MAPALLFHEDVKIFATFNLLVAWTCLAVLTASSTTHAAAVTRKRRPSSCLENAKNLKASLSDKLEDFLTCHVAKINFSGIVLVGYDDDDLNKRNILTEKAFGFADTTPTHLRLNERDTPVLLGSITKQFVSALTLKLISEKKLDFESKAVDLAPEISAFQDPLWKNITVRELLAHSSGIPDYVNDGGFDATATKDPDVSEIIKQEATLRLKFAPGKYELYSNTNYLILGKILEHVTNKPWSRIVEEEITKPLLLQHTGIYDLKQMHSTYAVGYTHADQNNEAVYRNPKLFSAVGDMVSTVEDLFLWEHYLFSTNIIVPSQMRAQYLEHPFLKEYSAAAVVANGLGSEVSKDHQIVYKTGHLGGYANVVSYFPANRLVIIILSNVEEHVNQSPFILPMMAKLAGLVLSSEQSDKNLTPPPPPPTPKVTRHGQPSLPSAIPVTKP